MYCWRRALRLEIPLNSPRALDSISLLRERVGMRAIVGAGTVLTTEQVDSVVDAGGQVIISPNMNPSVIHRSEIEGLSVYRASPRRAKRLLPRRWGQRSEILSCGNDLPGHTAGYVRGITASRSLYAGRWCFCRGATTTKMVRGGRERFWLRRRFIPRGHRVRTGPA